MSDSIVSLDEARRQKKKEKPPTADIKDCPIVALGHANGRFFFLDLAGQVRELSARALGQKSELAALFGGNVKWLETAFRASRVVKNTIGGETVTEVVDASFNAAEAGYFLMRQASDAGIYGPHVILRRPGIWRASDGAPAVHCGSKILIDGKWSRAGQRIDGTVWVAGADLPVPAEHPSDAAPGIFLRDEIARLWSFRRAGGAIICMGLIGAGYFGAAAPWRPNGFLCGGIGSGKSMLLDVMRAASPMHHYTNNTSAAGVQGAMAGHAMPVYIDEASDSIDQSGAQRLMDIVLSASRGEGVKGHRGTVDGGVRIIEMAGSFVYGSVAPPELQPQHLARITLIDLVQPGAGRDHRADMEALIEQATEHGPGLWARALDLWPVWLDAVDVYRSALAQAGCTPREMDQMSALLAGHRILVADTVPTAAQALIDIAAIRDFIRVAEDIADDDGPRRVAQHLLAQRIQFDGTTRQTQVGEMLIRAWGPGGASSPEYGAEVERAIDVLGRYGIRPIRGDDPARTPRMADGDGMWIMAAVARALFHNTRWDGDRWRVELLRLPHSRPAPRFNVRVGGVTGKCIWLSRADVMAEEPVGFADLCRALDRTPAETLGLMERHAGRFPIAQTGRTVEADYLFVASHVIAFLRGLSDGPLL